jgi:four helix bundle protein
MHRFEDLKVWQNAIQLVKEVYLILPNMPKEEKYAISEQIRRSAVSIPSNIAEGAGRNNNGEFYHFLGIANASANELMTQLILIKELGLINGFDPSMKIENIKLIQNMIYKLQLTLKKS